MFNWGWEQPNTTGNGPEDHCNCKNEGVRPPVAYPLKEKVLKAKWL